MRLRDINSPSQLKGPGDLPSSRHGGGCPCNACAAAMYRDEDRDEDREVSGTVRPFVPLPDDAEIVDGVTVGDLRRRLQAEEERERAWRAQTIRGMAGRHE